MGDAHRHSDDDRRSDTATPGHLRGVLRPLLDPAARRIRKWRFAGSAGYWERRYGAGLDSGIGSYGRLAQFKAEFLNDFVRAQSIRSVIEFGCGDGNQLSLADYPQYLGLGVAPAAIDLCVRRFATDSSKSFYFHDKSLRRHGAGLLGRSGALVGRCLPPRRGR